jgi:hypothetical protein
MDKPKSLIRAEKEVTLKMIMQRLCCDSYEELREFFNAGIALLDELNL